MSSPALESVSPAVIADLEAVSRLTARRDQRGASLTTLAIGGPLAALFEPHSTADLAALLSGLSERGLSWRVLGLGSNVLIADSGIAVPVIRLGRGFRSWERTGPAEIRAGGAMPLMSLSRALAEEGLSGFEFAGGIPGAIGGGVRMNAGAHGGELGDRLVAVEVVLPDGTVEWLNAADLHFAYRSTALPAGAVVTAARLTVTPASPADVTAALQRHLAERKARQPLASPSVGSVFVNPSEELAAGKLIEELGLKGATRGGAIISDLHGNWILNPDRRASAEDFLGLVRLCEERARAERGIALKREFEEL